MSNDPRTDPSRPRFVLEPWDVHAPLLARIWAMIREDYVRNGLKPRTDMMSAEQARQRAYEMERWYRANDVHPVLTMAELQTAEIAQEAAKEAKDGPTP